MRGWGLESQRRPIPSWGELSKKFNVDFLSEQSECSEFSAATEEEERKFDADGDFFFRSSVHNSVGSFSDMGIENDMDLDSSDDDDDDDDDVDDGFQDTKWRFRNDDFFADSPYFNAFMEKEVYSINIMAATAKDLGAKARAFGKSGSQMTKALRSLALSCRLGPEGEKSSPEALKARREALGPDIAGGLERLGEMMLEIASAQEHLCQRFETTLAMHLEQFPMNEADVFSIEDEAKTETNKAEELLFKYINGKEAGGNFENPNASLLNIHQDEFAFTKALKVGQWNLDMEKIRVRQTSAELKRFQLSKKLVETKFDYNCELSSGTRQFLNEMLTYFTHCSALVTGFMPPMEALEEKCKEALSTHQGRDIDIWQKREQKLLEMYNSIKDAQRAARRKVRRIADQDEILSQALDWMKVEEQVNIWDLPKQLASCCDYHRVKAPGVIVEGWLYQKTNSYLHSASWDRAWFVLRQEGIFCFQLCNQLRREQKNNSIAKVKICDVELCTVREYPEGGDPSVRFRFELVVPTLSKPIVLQARGPLELRMWVNGIRTAISRRLAIGTFAESNNKTSPMARGGRRGMLPRQSSEIRITVLENKNMLKNIERSETINEDSEEGMTYTEDDDVTKQIMAANPTCADCGKASPDWASLNLGILMCLECSGVHRSLGVHVSKVRSLRLDSLNDGEASLLLSLGNDCVNQFWEKNVDAQFALLRPNSSSDRQSREIWIKRKYVKKQFIGGLNNRMKNNSRNNSDDDISTTTSEQSCREVYAASKKGDVVALMNALIQGGRVDWKNQDEGGKTPLEVCGNEVHLGETDKTKECEELLIQNGAKSSIQQQQQQEAAEDEGEEDDEEDDDEEDDDEEDDDDEEEQDEEGNVR